MRLSGKVAIVTGAASGIGEASARLFAAEGARVVVADRRTEGKAVADSIVESVGADVATFVQVDVSNAAGVERMVNTAVERFGRLDVLFNNAGIMGGEGLIVDCSEERWEHIIMVNLKGPWLGMKYAIPAMAATGGGSIITTSSHAADMGIPRRGAYSSSKNGVQGLTRICAIEAAQQGIRANCVVPGATMTHMAVGGGLERPGWHRDPEEVAAELATMHPLGRAGRPEDIANAALWLASDDASLVTGQTIVIDGGWAAAPRLPMSALGLMGGDEVVTSSPLAHESF